MLIWQQGDNLNPDRWLFLYILFFLIARWKRDINNGLTSVLVVTGETSILTLSSLSLQSYCKHSIAVSILCSRASGSLVLHQIMRGSHIDGRLTGCKQSGGQAWKRGNVLSECTALATFRAARAEKSHLIKVFRVCFIDLLALSKIKNQSWGVAD